MDPFSAMIIAGLMSAMIVNKVPGAWQNAKQRAADANQRVAEQARQRAQRAWSTGPRDPYWWPYAAGRAGRALWFGGRGFFEGVREATEQGRAEGRAFGRFAADQGMNGRQAFAAWRARRRAAKMQPRRDRAGRAADPDSPQPETHDYQQCARCGVFCPMNILSPNGWCISCIEDTQPQPDQTPVGGREQETQPLPVLDPATSRCDGRCQNSALPASEARGQGHCGACGGDGELITNFGGEHKHVSCPSCRGSGAFADERPLSSTVHDTGFYGSNMRVQGSGHGQQHTYVIPDPPGTHQSSGGGTATLVATAVREDLPALPAGSGHNGGDMTAPQIANGAPSGTVENYADLQGDLTRLKNITASLHANVIDSLGSIKATASGVTDLTDGITAQGIGAHVFTPVNAVGEHMDRVAELFQQMVNELEAAEAAAAQAEHEGSTRHGSHAESQTAAGGSTEVANNPVFYDGSV